jgi:hypothetical protein
MSGDELSDTDWLPPVVRSVAPETLRIYQETTPRESRGNNAFRNLPRDRGFIGLVKTWGGDAPCWRGQAGIVGERLRDRGEKCVNDLLSRGRWRDIDRVRNPVRMERKVVEKRSPSRPIETKAPPRTGPRVGEIAEPRRSWCARPPELELKVVSSCIDEAFDERKRRGEGSGVNPGDRRRRNLGASGQSADG